MDELKNPSKVWYKTVLLGNVLRLKQCNVNIESSEIIHAL
jgi:hypothetical protein